MTVEETFIPGLKIITPQLFGDARGYFFESYNAVLFSGHGMDMQFVQDNESGSSQHVLRGLHFQAPPFDQGKLVRVVRGSVLDVAVDIRKGSPTYGRHFAIRLDAISKKMFWIPPGFAHGFAALEDETVFSYKCTQVYHKASEGSLRWNDPELGISWGIDNPVVSEKDAQAPAFRELESPFNFER